jgi:hypothetical protein
MCLRKLYISIFAYPHAYRQKSASVTAVSIEEMLQSQVSIMRFDSSECVDVVGTQLRGGFCSAAHS